MISSHSFTRERTGKSPLQLVDGMHENAKLPLAALHFALNVGRLLLQLLQLLIQPRHQLARFYRKQTENKEERKRERTVEEERKNH